MTAVDAHEHGARPLLEGRYRLERTPEPPTFAPVLVDAYDEASDRAVTLVLLPASSSLRDRLALRLQVRRAAETEDPGLAPVLDVIDTEATLALVLPLLPGARPLIEVGALPEDAPAQLLGALDALHAVGRPHGALDERAVVVLPDSTVLLLPLAPEPGALPAEDLPALERLAARYGSGHPEDVPVQRHPGSHRADAGRPTVEQTAARPTPSGWAVPAPIPPQGATSVADRHRSWRHGVGGRHPLAELVEAHLDPA